MVRKNDRLTDDGFEVLDDTPVAMPVRFKRPENLVSEVQRLVAGELSRLAAAQGHESFDEADDFDVGDDYDPRSPYELDDGQLEYDMRDDDRYKARDAAEERIAGEGDSESEGELRESGESAVSVETGEGEDTGKSSKRVVKQRPVKGVKRSVP